MVWREKQLRSSRRWELRRKWKRQVWLLLLQDAPTALEARPWRVMQAGESAELKKSSLWSGQSAGA